MGNEEAPKITKRTTRSSSSTVHSNSTTETRKTNDPHPLSTSDYPVIGEEPTNLDALLSCFPGRRLQIQELLHLIGPLNCPMLPLFLYGGASTGKTSIIVQIFRHLKRPFVYSSCRTCYSPRILFESTLNQLLLHRRNMENSYSSAKRCERPADFVNFLREALTDFINNLKGYVRKSCPKEPVDQGGGRMVYLIFDNVELIQEWDKNSGIISLLFKLHDILKMPDVGLIFISNTSPDTYYSNTGYVEPIPVHFPDYNEGDLSEIFMRNQKNPKLYSSFLDVVLRSFCRITKRVDELSTAFQPLFEKYCEPISDAGIVPNEEMKRRLFSHLRPHIASALNEDFKVSSVPSFSVEANKNKSQRKGSIMKFGTGEYSDELDLHLSISAKYLLISAFLASRNPATLDASLFDSTGGSDGRKRRRKSSVTAMEHKETAEKELLMKGPGSFPLERLLAIFQCLISVAEGPLEEEQQDAGQMESDDGEMGLMSDVLLHLSTLCNANFVTKGGTCPLEGSTRYRCNVAEEMALKVARSLKFPLSKYLYRR
ncbi:origin of replication complex subunit 5 isoform X2 [Macadamia integrifolia]|uniref:origin of replication complex subunit 5 isoform X2 n=1 Tax=Macadamia integrifolia TaxID=60698 RepID=UPI001C532943|nr:origin of replication complex subunit 5 isoform X2 [Macadamia integrifolia]